MVVLRWFAVCGGPHSVCGHGAQVCGAGALAGEELLTMKLVYLPCQVGEHRHGGPRVGVGPPTFCKPLA